MIARRAGTVSSSSASMRLSTRRFASSGSQRSTASSSRSTPSFTSSMVAAAAIGFVSEAIRKMVSRRIGWLSGPPAVVVPIASTRTSSPRATSVTSPGMSPRSTTPTIAAWTLSLVMSAPSRREG